MRKRLITISLLLAAGAAINVLVAWACALYLSTNFGPVDLSSDEAAAAPFIERAPFALPTGAEVDHHALFGRSWGMRIRVISIVGPGGRWSADETWGCVAVESGFPLPALGGEGWRHDLDAAGRGHELNETGLLALPESLAGRLGSTRTRLPWRPLWANFAVNTLIFTAVLWLAIIGPITIRRIIRERAGSRHSRRDEAGPPRDARAPRPPSSFPQAGMQCRGGESYGALSVGLSG